MNAVLLEQDLSAHDLVDPFFLDLQPPQLLGDFDGIAAGAEIGRRALQHGDMRALSAMFGISVAAVAPEPITTICLPSVARSSGQVCGCTIRPLKSSMPFHSGV